MLAAKARGAGGLVEAGGGTGDPFFSDVSLLLHCDGTNGSTTITDSSSNNFTVTAVGGAQIDTSVQKFGTGSLKFDGVGDAARISANSAFRLDGDFTIEGWHYPVTRVQLYPAVFLIGQAFSGTNQNILLYFDHQGNRLKYILIINSVAYIYTATAVTFNQWNHFAITRDGNTVRFFLNGVQDGSATFTGAIFTFNPAVDLGIEASKGFTVLAGNLDDFRITKGVARYTSNFTPPTQAFPDS